VKNLGYQLAHTTIAEILERHGMDPAPERSRKTTGKEFLSQHLDQIVAADCFTVEVWTAGRLQRLVVGFLLECEPRATCSWRASRRM
jgi:hypothetical protein